MDADRIRYQLAQTPAALVGNAAGMALLAVVFHGTAPGGWMVGWLAVVGGLWLCRVVHHAWFLRLRREALPVLRRVHRVWVALVLLQGAGWGATAWLFYGWGEAFHRMALILTAYTYALGAVPLLAMSPRVFMAFTGVVLVPIVARVATHPAEPHGLALAGILSLLFVVTWTLAGTYRDALGRAVRLKARTDDLAAQLQLRAEEATTAREAAEVARGEAEAANRAKTQFLAAASHDLRQPLHALGLFAEALRGRVHDAQAAPLIHSINESVAALETLFSQLLDITRIDAGGVVAQPQPVALRELFARLRLHFEPVAFEQGLVLRFLGERHVAQADPVLLERVLRNLLSNALRYTRDGGVIVSCRRRGDRLRLQVWDTGVGIASEELPRIAQEFYQVPGQATVTPQQAKGLGLGLSIVQRLCRLMDIGQAVRSVPGRGTVFSLDVPAGRLALPSVPSAAEPALPGVSLHGRTLWVVDDDRAVREGLSVLLEGWGAQVRAFEGLAALRDGLTPDAGPAPDLVLVDLQLGRGDTGLQALQLVRAHWHGQAIPAIVITGSTLGGVEALAETHDFHLLTKPVLPNRLRALVAFKLRLRPGSA